MTRIADIMSVDVQTVQPQESLRRAAQCMQDLDVGSLPVCNGERLLGMLTDRDIVVRGIADGLDPDTACVSDVMSPEPACCTPEQDTESAKRLMGERQIRRLPVVDSDRRLVGIVSLGDVALRESGHVDRALREISTPGRSG
ncbi:CBS domain-containing protein [Pelomonas cellulosilytica]|uniref:CBS domain-containing protein n=1 Tax=Pelomonas cellulosilytica TaxID=2906762 RepID=A0ABS8XQD9_9BURK|nr:CBS domain-containing protein [Pelomonas sp. P8]MCE4553122.1 CBS domain-containing protein [Pelomonas sp. P8]